MVAWHGERATGTERDNDGLEMARGSPRERKVARCCFSSSRRRRIGVAEFIIAEEEDEGDPVTECSPARVPGRRGSSGQRRVF